MGWVAPHPLWALALFVAVTLGALPVSAQPSDADRAEARKLAGEAMDLFSAGDYGAALPKFQRADELVPAPTLALRVARCLDKLDRVKEAAEAYRKVIAYELKPGDKAVYREAREQAVPELNELLKQVPSVIVTVVGSGADRAELSVGGTPLPAELMGEKQELDPGFYLFSAKVDERVAKKELNLGRGEHIRVELALPDARDGAPPPGGDSDGGGSNDAMWIGGWVALSVGIVGLGVGIGAGAVVLSQEGDLETRCPNRQCPPEAHADAESFDTLRIASTVGFIVGGVGSALGTTLLVLVATDDSEDSAEASRVTPWIAPLGGGVRVAF